MPGKAGPEHGRRGSSALDNFLLRGTYPVPKPSYGEPYQSTVNAPSVIQSHIFITPPKPILKTSKSVDVFYTSGGFQLLDPKSRNFSQSQEDLSCDSSQPESGLGSTLRSNSFSLLNRASLDNSGDIDILYLKTDRQSSTDFSEFQSVNHDNPKTPLEVEVQEKEKSPPLSGRERLRLIEEQNKLSAESEQKLDDGNPDIDNTEDIWESLDFQNKREKFERMASQDSSSELNKAALTVQKSQGSIHFNATERHTLAPSDTAVSDKVSSNSDLSVHSLENKSASRESSSSQGSSGTHVNKVKGGSIHGHVPHHVYHDRIHKTPSGEQMSYSTHLDPHHIGTHYSIHKTSSEEDVAVPGYNSIKPLDSNDMQNDETFDSKITQALDKTNEEKEEKEGNEKVKQGSLVEIDPDSKVKFVELLTNSLQKQVIDASTSAVTTNSEKSTSPTATDYHASGESDDNDKIPDSGTEGAVHKPKDSRKVDPGRMTKRIGSDESSGNEAETDIRAMKVPPKRFKERPNSAAISRLLSEQTVSDIGYNSEHDGVAWNYVPTERHESKHNTSPTEDNEQQDLHGILTNEHPLHKKKDSNVHFDDSHIAETKYFKPQTSSQSSQSSVDNMRQQNVYVYNQKKGVEDSDSENEVSRPIPPKKNARRRIGKNKAQNEVEAATSSKEGKNYSKSAAILDKIKQNQKFANMKPRSSLPVLSDDVLRELTAQLKPLILEEFATLDGQLESMDVNSNEVNRILSGIIERALESLNRMENVNYNETQNPSGQTSAYSDISSIERVERVQDYHQNESSGASSRSQNASSNSAEQSCSQDSISSVLDIPAAQMSPSLELLKQVGPHMDRHDGISHESSVPLVDQVLHHNSRETDAKYKSSQTDKLEIITKMISNMIKNYNHNEETIGKMSSDSVPNVSNLSQLETLIAARNALKIQNDTGSDDMPSTSRDQRSEALRQRRASIDYTTSSNLSANLMKRFANLNTEDTQYCNKYAQSEDRNREFSHQQVKTENQFADEMIELERNNSFHYTTPSRLLTKIQTREEQNIKGGAGSIPDMITPSQLMTKEVRRKMDIQDDINRQSSSRLVDKLRRTLLLKATNGNIEPELVGKDDGEEYLEDEDDHPDYLCNVTEIDSVILPTTYIEKDLKQMKRKSVPNSISPSTLNPARNKNQEHLKTLSQLDKSPDVTLKCYDSHVMDSNNSTYNVYDHVPASALVGMHSNKSKKDSKVTNLSWTDDKSGQKANDIAAFNRVLTDRRGGVGSVESVDSLVTLSDLDSRYNKNHQKEKSHKSSDDSESSSRSDFDLGLERVSTSVSSNSTYTVDTGRKPDETVEKKRFDTMLYWMNDQHSATSHEERVMQGATNPPNLPSYDYEDRRAASTSHDEALTVDLSGAIRSNTDMVEWATTYWKDKQGLELSNTTQRKLFNLICSDSTVADRVFSGKTSQNNNNITIGNANNQKNIEICKSPEYESGILRKESNDSMETHFSNVSSQEDKNQYASFKTIIESPITPAKVQMKNKAPLFTRSVPTPSDLLIKQVLNDFKNNGQDPTSLKTQDNRYVTNLDDQKFNFDLDQLSTTVSPSHYNTNYNSDERAEHAKYDNTFVFSPAATSTPLPPQPKSASLPPSVYPDLVDYDISRLQTAGASLPTSPSPDNALATGRRSAMGTADMRSYLVEKELIESQLRKLQVENSSLQTENKLQKEKYNRAQNRIQNLESQLLNQRHESDSMHSTLDEMSFSSRKNRNQIEHDKQDLEDKLMKMNRELENLKAENASLERQLQSSRISSDMLKHTGDKSQIIEGFRAELVAMREELAKVKALLVQSERDCQDMVTRQKESAAHIIKLTEVKSLLQQQIENSGGGTAAERQVKSLVTRLKITEDRLHQERGDRAGKLSELEEKLLNENSKLQVAEKELTRQLGREKEKNKNLDNKYKDAKDEIEKIRLGLGETTLQNMPHQAKYPKLSPNPSNDKNLREECSQYEEKLQKFREQIEDVTHEKGTIQRTMQKQLHGLVQEKHNSQARSKHLEDEIAAVQAENDSLRTTITSGSRNSGSRHNGEVNTLEAQIESLQSELYSSRGELQQNSRKYQLLEAELHSMQSQHQAKRKALDEALNDLSRMGEGGSNSGEREMEQFREHKLEKLNAQIRSLETELQLWHEKHASATRERDEIEERFNQLQRQMSRAKVTADGRIVDPAMESEKLSLESEVNEKDEQILHLTVTYNETENELQRTKQLLVLQQQHTDTLSDEMEQLHSDVRQKKVLLNRMATGETEHQVTLAAMKGNVAKLNRELAEVAHELKLKTVELSHEHSKVKKLESDLNERDQILSGNITQALQDGSLKSVLLGVDPVAGYDSLTHAEMQSRILQNEVDKQAHQIQKNNTVLHGLVQENSDLAKEARELQQELVCERAQLCQVASEKVEMEGRNHILEEENVGLIRAKAKLEQDLTKQEVAVGNLVERLEIEAHNAEADYEQRFRDLDKHGKKVATELATVRRLLEAREKEVDLLRDTIDRQKQENVSLSRRIQVLKEETYQSQQDIDKLTKELANQMKENAITSETTQTLSSERARLELQRNQLEMNQSKDHTDIERKNIEIQGLLKKLEKLEANHEVLQHQLNVKESEVCEIRQENAQLDSEKCDLKRRMNVLNEDIRHLNTVKDTVEQRLNLERSTVTKEKTDRSHLKDTLSQTSTQLEVVKREYDVLFSQLEQERRTVDKIKANYEQSEDRCYKLQDGMRLKSLECDSLNQEIRDTKARLEQYKKEKENLYEDVQNLCKQLSEKDESINRMKSAASDTVESLKVEFSTEKSLFIQDKRKLEADNYKIKEELEDFRQQVKQKENQVDMFMRTNKDLESGVREKYELENEVSRLNSELNEMRRNLTRVEADNTRLLEACKTQQSNLEESRAMLTSLKQESRSINEKSTLENGMLNRSLLEEKRLHQFEVNDLKDKLQKTSTDLRSTQLSLAAIQENRGTLEKTTKLQEITLSSLKTQVYEETTARKLAEQRVESLQGQLQDIRDNKAEYSSMTTELQARYTKIETELQIEKEKFQQLKQDFDELQNSNFRSEAQAKAYKIKVCDLESENSNLRSRLDTTKQDYSGKNKRLSLDLKQQEENFEKDRSKLMAQSQQLSIDLDQCRNQLCEKNKENLSLQEQVLGLESQLRESTNSVKHISESLKLEAETRDKLDKRNMELELLVAKLRSKDGNDIDSFETTKAEVQRMLTELSKRMQQQLDTQKGYDSETRNRDLKKIEDLKRKIGALESLLSQEQALHIISKTQMQSLDDDNARLRQTLQSLRKRHSQADNSDRNKSRSEAINAIIAKSQTQAQQMLASGNFTVDTSTTTQLPNSQYWSLTSSAQRGFGGPSADHNRSLGADDISLSLNSTGISATLAK